MESKVEYTETPPSYTPPAPIQHQAAAPPAPGPTSYASPGHLQYPPPAQYPGGQAPYGQYYGYDQPPAGYPPSASVRPLQQQQQVVVVSGAQQQQPVIVQYVPSYGGHIVFACFVLCLCNPLFGLIAFILAG